MPTGIYDHSIKKTGWYQICPICNKKFWIVPYESNRGRKYCSFQCARISLRGKSAHNKGLHIKYNDALDKWRKENGIVWNKGIKIDRIKYPKMGHFQKHSLKTKSLLRSKNLGKFAKQKHWNWKGGISPLTAKIRSSDKYKQWVRKIFQRDFYTCQKCRQKIRSIEAHHIVDFTSILNEIRYAYPDHKITYKKAMKHDFLWDTENGITLCKKCHKLYR